MLKEYLSFALYAFIMFVTQLLVLSAVAVGLLVVIAQMTHHRIENPLIGIGAAIITWAISRPAFHRLSDWLSEFLNL